MCFSCISLCSCRSLELWSSCSRTLDSAWSRIDCRVFTDSSAASDICLISASCSACRACRSFIVSPSFTRFSSSSSFRTFSLSSATSWSLSFFPLSRSASSFTSAASFSMSLLYSCSMLSTWPFEASRAVSTMRAGHAGLCWHTLCALITLCICSALRSPLCAAPTLPARHARALFVARSGCATLYPGAARYSADPSLADADAHGYSSHFVASRFVARGFLSALALLAGCLLARRAA